MAYGVKYRCEWTDIQGVDWKVDILEDSWAGAISAMIASGEPLAIDYLTPGDDLTLGPIKGSMATLNIECTTNFEYIGLYSEEDLLRPMNVYKNEVLYWAGWLSNEYTEPYDNVPYTVSITASDALGILKNIEYKDEGDDYTGRTTESSIILEILAKIGKTQFTEFCNLYEDRMDDAVDDSPFDQVLIDNDLFIDTDCYSVLQAILLKYNAVIRQKAGEFIIYRPIELIGDTVYGRVITAASTTGTSITPDYEIDRDALELIDVEGGVMMYKAPMSTFTVVQDYGYKESWLDNHTLAIDKWTIDQPDGWTDTGLGQRVSTTYLTSNETDGIIFPPVSVVPNPVYYCYQDFGVYAKASTDTFLFEFEYQFVKLTDGDTTNKDVCVMLFSTTDSYFLTIADDVECEWSATSDTVQFTEASITAGLNGWKKFSRYIQGLPASGEYRIMLFPSSGTGVWLAYRNIRFLATSDEIEYSKTKRKKASWTAENVSVYAPGKRFTKVVFDEDEIVSRTYEVDNSISGDVVEQEYILGDCEDTNIVNVVEAFKGALAISLTGSLEQTATDFVNDFADDYAALVSPSVLLTSSGDTLYFTSATPGTNFTGATSIVNATGTLAGAASTVTANSAGTVQIETITLSGNSGTADVSMGGLAWEATWNTSLTQTAADFVTAWAADFVSFNITLTSNNEDLIFTEATAAGGFSAPTIANTSGTLTGTVYHTQAASGAVARVDKIILSGTSGTATVTCHANAETATYNTDTILTHTASWHTRGNTEALPLAELIGDEVADMYSKGRQMVQLNMIELTESLDILNNLQDPLNLVGANNRVFAFNRGSLNAQMREWTIDIIEIGDK